MSRVLEICESDLPNREKVRLIYRAAATGIVRERADIADIALALEPFARIGADDGDDFGGYPAQTIIRCEVTVGEILAAREALARIEAGTDETPKAAQPVGREPDQAPKGTPHA